MYDDKIEGTKVLKLSEIDVEQCDMATVYMSVTVSRTEGMNVSCLVIPTNLHFSKLIKRKRREENDFVHLIHYKRCMTLDILTNVNFSRGDTSC